MDLRQYFRKVRELEKSIPQEDVYVVSLETADGGRAGVISEVRRDVASRMVVEGRARLASEEESQKYRAELLQAQQAEKQREAQQRINVHVLSDLELRTLKGVRGARE